MTVSMAPTAINAVTVSTVVTLSCDRCGNSLAVTALSARVERMAANVEAAHRMVCRRGRAVEPDRFHETLDAALDRGRE